MKTLEVLERVLKGKQLREVSKGNYRYSLGSLARYSEDWPSEGYVINEWLNSLKGYSDSTVLRYFKDVHSAGRYVQKISGRNPDGSWKFKNPCDDAERPKVAKKQRRYFTREEMMRIVKACSNEYELCLIMTLIDSGGRIGGIAGLSGGDIGNGFMTVVEKTGQRHYRLDTRLCLRMKVLAGGDDKPVFKKVDGSRVKVAGLKARVRRIVLRAGLTGKKLGPHTFRHSVASMIAVETKSALAVKAVLQHDNINTSMGYIHDAEESILQGISPLDIVYSGSKPAEQLVFADGRSESLLEVENGVVVEGDDLISGLFPVIADGVEVRPLLRAKDLNLVRGVVVEFARGNRGDSRIYAMQELMRRVLRKAKSKGQ